MTSFEEIHSSRHFKPPNQAIWINLSSMKSNVKSWVWWTVRRLNRFKQSVKLCLIKDYGKVNFWVLDLLTDLLRP